MTGDKTETDLVVPLLDELRALREEPEDCEPREEPVLRAHSWYAWVLHTRRQRARLSPIGLNTHTEGSVTLEPEDERAQCEEAVQDVRIHQVTRTAGGGWR